VLRLPHADSRLQHYIQVRKTTIPWRQHNRAVRSKLVLEATANAFGIKGVPHSPCTYYGIPQPYHSSHFFHFNTHIHQDPGVNPTSEKEHHKLSYTTMVNEQEPGAREMNILLSLVNDQTMTPEKAFQQIVAITEATKSQKDQLGNHCYFTALAVLEAACRNAPETHPKIIAFIQKLRKQNVIDPSTVQALVHDDEVVWQGLPTFGYTFADELNSFPGKTPAPHDFENETLTSTRHTTHPRKDIKVGEHRSVHRATRCKHSISATRLFQFVCTHVHQEWAHQPGSQVRS
jgi:hypothetical protein